MPTWPARPRPHVVPVAWTQGGTVMRVESAPLFLLRDVCLPQQRWPTPVSPCSLGTGNARCPPAVPAPCWTTAGCGLREWLCTSVHRKGTQTRFRHLETRTGCRTPAGLAFWGVYGEASP